MRCVRAYYTHVFLKKNNMDVRLWGPDFWNSMHAVTFAYPENNPSAEERVNMYRYFWAVAYVLPCVQCRVHFVKMLKNYPVERHLGSRKELTRWLIDRHNDVNKRLNKPVVSYEFVEAKYGDYSNTCKSSSIGNSNNSQQQQLLFEVTPMQKTVILSVLAMLGVFMFALLLYLLFFAKSGGSGGSSSSSN